jgi:hypothetical protein
MIEPIDLLQRRVLHAVDVAPRTTTPDELRLVQPVDGFGRNNSSGISAILAVRKISEAG